jgi:hypothetical protein
MCVMNVAITDQLGTAPLLVAADEVRAAITAGEAAWNDEQFERLAFQLFASQRRAIAPYGAWCTYELGQRTERDAHSWRDIPALPIAAFKAMRIASALPTVATWLSSGTTAAERSRHELADTAQYEASLDHGVHRALLPDVVAGERDPLTCIQLQPSAATGATQSSLTHMFDRIRTSVWCVDGGAFVDAEFRLDAEAAWLALEDAAAAQQPVLLLATSFALAMLFEAAAEHGWDAIELPEGSRVVDTGGYKGRTRELTRDELVAQIGTWLGVAPTWCENEYGMSELSSQCWLGNVAAAAGHPLGDAPRWMPPWLRVRVVDPTSLTDVADGEQGLLVFHDLANVWSCAAIRSEDLAIRRGDSFQLVGRAPGAALKGCSLQLEDL